MKPSNSSNLFLTVDSAPASPSLCSALAVGAADSGGLAFACLSCDVSDWTCFCISSSCAESEPAALPPAAHGAGREGALGLTGPPYTTLLARPQLLQHSLSAKLT
eukprot:1308507-Pyramimonas_sp.AAC.1